MSERGAAPERLLTRISEVAPEFGLAGDRRLPQLARYLAELSRWRSSTGLVGRLSDEDLARHALESALGTRLLPARATFLDIGSGAGFPGIPLAIWGHDVTLLEPRQRRAAFLRHVLRAIPGLNATVRAVRVEHLSGPPFEAAGARAVGDLARLIGRAEFLREGGTLLVWTTDPEGLARELGTFALRGALAVPGSRTRQIAQFEKCSTGNSA
jgi:16S rRNA (guanine527-N7)-methyltransferase